MMLTTSTVGMLTLPSKGLSSPAYRDWLDYTIVEDGDGGGASMKIG